jgi:hypothetical protein
LVKEFSMQFSDYDLWKTTEPEYYDTSEECPDCGKPPDRCRCEENADIAESVSRSNERRPDLADRQFDPEPFQPAEDEKYPF